MPTDYVETPETTETGGKGDNFPLLNPESRARGPEDDLSLEIPAIVDPTNTADVAMLTFGPSGEVELVPECKGERIAEEKLEASRRYLHLNWPRFREERVMLYNEIERTVHRGEDLAPEELQWNTCGCPTVHGYLQGSRDVDEIAPGILPWQLAPMLKCSGIVGGFAISC